MLAWQEDLLGSLDIDSLQPTEIFARMEAAARSLGFDYCAYGIRVPIPATKPQVFMLTNYPPAWRHRYFDDARYYTVDPTVRHGYRSRAPIVWSDSVFADVPQLWHEARAHGLRVGWAQSTLDGHGVAGMLTLARAGGNILHSELKARELKMRWLVNISHLVLSRRLIPQLAGRPSGPLTPREIEVLRWTADGKTVAEISDILKLSEHTVTFHVGNAVRKLGSPNKTAAVVKASLLGLL